ncbi:MAG: TolC family protein, partial [bacterium]|nr:TolC family protein [bacterium]
SQKGQARAALLPQIESHVSRDTRTVNLRAFGVSFGIPGTPFQTPTGVGPFHVFDVRANGNQSLFNLSAIRRYQASKTGVAAARADEESTRDLVATQVAKAYLAALRAQATLEAAQANVDLAGALLKLAENQKAAGTGTGIDVTRALVQLSNEKQLLLVAENNRTRAHLELLRAMDLSLATGLQLTDRLTFHPAELPAVDGAIEAALNSRSDWRAQQKREANARLHYSATKWERLPKLSAFGDYGSIGSTATDAFPTRTYGARLSVPIFDGGRMDYARSESSSRLRQQKIRTADLRARIELEIRLALDSLRSASEQVTVAREGFQLAENELAQARRRFQAGVTNSVEVTDAQNRLARARDNQIAALFHYESARLDLGQAMGAIRDWIQ